MGYISSSSCNNNDDNDKVRTTAEAVAIVLAGVGALCTILAPKILRAKQELEGKALVGPSAVVSSSSCDGFGGAGDTTSGVSVLSGHRKSGGRRRPLSSSSLTGSRNGGSLDPVGVFGKTLAGDPPDDLCPDANDTGRQPRYHGGSGDIYDSRQQRDKTSAISRPGSMAGIAAPCGGNFATTGGSREERRRGLVVPDPSGFCTPPKRIRRARSSVECSTRSADGMALAAAAAGAAQKHREMGQSGRLVRGGSGRGVLGSDRGERAASSTASLSGLSGERRGSGHGSARPPTSGGASESSRASRGSIASSGRGRSRTATRSSKTSRSTRGGSSGGSGCGDSTRSSRDSWVLDPLMLAINGYGWGGAGGTATVKQVGGSGGGGGGWSERGNGGQAQRKSGGGGGVRRSGRWSGSGGAKRGASKERSSSLGSSSARGRRSSAAGSLVMHVDTGTRLHCPHCDKEVSRTCGITSCRVCVIQMSCGSSHGSRKEIVRVWAQIVGWGCEGSLGGRGMSVRRGGSALSIAQPPFTVPDQRPTKYFRTSDRIDICLQSHTPKQLIYAVL